MNLVKVIRNRIWQLADKTRTRLGEKRFLDTVNKIQNKSYEEVHSHWEKTETSVHHQASEADLKVMSEYIAEALCLTPEDCVLDIGCGDGQIDFFLKEKCGHLNGFDFSKTKIEEAKARNAEASYFVASFLDDYKEKCQDINKIFSYGVMQYCKPEDTKSFIRHSVETLSKGGGEVVHLDVPDKGKAAIYYSLIFGVPLEIVNRMKDDIKYIFSDGSYWHDMKEIKKECEAVCREVWKDAGDWYVMVENSNCFYRSNVHICLKS